MSVRFYLKGQQGFDDACNYKYLWGFYSVICHHLLEIYLHFTYNLAWRHTEIIAFHHILSCSRSSHLPRANILFAWLNFVHYEMLVRSEEHTSELQSRETISYAVFCLKKKTNKQTNVSTVSHPNDPILPAYSAI